MLTDDGRGLPAAGSTALSKPYHQGLSLDMLGQPTITAGVSGRVGGFVSGGCRRTSATCSGIALLSVSGLVGGSCSISAGSCLREPQAPLELGRRCRRIAVSGRRG